MKKIIIIRSAAIIERRTQLTIEALREAGYSITYLALDREYTYPKVENDSNVTIYRFRFKWFEHSIGGIFILPIWWAFIFFKLLKEDCDYIHCIDLDTLPPAFIAAKLRGIKIIYEMFDYVPDIYPHSYGIEFIRPILKKIDDTLIPRVDGLIVADEIRYSQIGLNIIDKCKKVVIIYNSPKDTYKDIDNKNKNKNFTIFYGGILEKDRYLLCLIDAVSKLPESKLVIGGHGHMEKQVKEAATKYPNVIFLGKVDTRSIIENTKRADLIPCLYDPQVPNNVYASPGKFFESLMMGKPCLAFRESLFSKRIKDFNCGVIISAKSDIAGQIREVIEDLSEKPEMCTLMGKNARRVYLNNFSDKDNEVRLQKFYADL
jgi:glycosyltransferase involved in cell wall biosynthesis